jgi:hypothetical protein
LLSINNSYNLIGDHFPIWAVGDGLKHVLSLVAGKSIVGNNSKLNIEATKDQIYFKDSKLLKFLNASLSKKMQNLCVNTSFYDEPVTQDFFTSQRLSNKFVVMSAAQNKSEKR